jgi:hypothetical protein
MPLKSGLENKKKPLVPKIAMILSPTCHSREAVQEKKHLPGFIMTPFSFSAVLSTDHIELKNSNTLNPIAHPHYNHKETCREKTTNAQTCTNIQGI